MKMYEKSSLSLLDGLLVAADGTVVAPDSKVIDQANELETLIQEAAYLMKQPNAAPAPSLSGFERKSVFKIEKKYFTAETPALDKKVNEAMTLMDELDDATRVTDINNHIQHFADLVRFADADRIMCFEGDGCNRFDTPVLGDPLKLSADDVTDKIAFIHGVVAAEENGKAEADEQE